MNGRCRQVWEHLQRFSSLCCFLCLYSWFVRHDYSQTIGRWELLEDEKMQIRLLKSMDFWIWDRYVTLMVCSFSRKSLILPAVALNNDHQLLLVLHWHLHRKHLAIALFQIDLQKCCVVYIKNKTKKNQQYETKPCDYTLKMTGDGESADNIRD